MQVPQAEVGIEADEAKAVYNIQNHSFTTECTATQQKGIQVDGSNRLQDDFTSFPDLLITK